MQGKEIKYGTNGSIFLKIVNFNKILFNRIGIKHVLIFFRFLKIFLFKKTSFSNYISLFCFSNDRIKKRCDSPEQGFNFYSQKVLRVQLNEHMLSRFTTLKFYSVYILKKLNLSFFFTHISFIENITNNLITTLIKEYLYPFNSFSYVSIFIDICLVNNFMKYFKLLLKKICFFCLNDTRFIYFLEKRLRICHESFLSCTFKENLAFLYLVATSYKKNIGNYFSSFFFTIKNLIFSEIELNKSNFDNKLFHHRKLKELEKEKNFKRKWVFKTNLNILKKYQKIFDKFFKSKAKLSKPRFPFQRIKFILNLELELKILFNQYEN